MYTGNIGRAQNFQDLIKTMQLVKENIHWVFVGDGRFKEEFKSLLKQNNVIHKGVIAQELKQILPEAVLINKHDEYDDFHSVHYTELIPHLVNCIKELYKELNEFKTVGGLITKTIKGLSENPTDNSKVENEVKNEVISLTSSFPIYKNL